MKVDEKAVRKVARLARIRLKNDEISRWQNDLSQILSWVEQLDEVKTEQVSPMFSVYLKEMPCRLDVVTEGDAPHSVVSNAPKTEFDMFVVPKVVE